MARKRKKKTKMKSINSLYFNNDRKPDEDVISQINAYCRLPENRGHSPRALIRNFLLRKLDEAIQKSTKKQAG